MHYIGKSGEIITKICEQCSYPLAYRADGKSQPLTCESCFSVSGIEYLKWDVKLTCDEHKEYVVPLGLGASSKEAIEVRDLCQAEIARGAPQARGWIMIEIVPQGWPFFD